MKVITMKYPNITPTKFIFRENRFVATVKLQGEEIKVHVKNTGRCKELLVPGATVYLTHADNPKRKYAYDLVAVQKGELLINMDSQAPNAVFREYLESGGFADGITQIQPEYAFGNSRIDFYFERNGERNLVEIKGVTLENQGICRFPDAPTVRGTKHLHELTNAVQQGWKAWVCFVVQMSGMQYMEPNRITDPAFAQALKNAADAGVKVRALGCHVEPDELWIDGEVPVHIE